MSTPVDRHSLRVGALVAEGGEGKVYELPGRPGQLYKAYRQPVPAGALEPLLAWRAALDVDHPSEANRVGTATAWPTELVVDRRSGGGMVAGLLLPRAPARFSVRHKDGIAHLATLSYLTADPRQRAASYGIRLPAPASVERLALVYALARVLEALDTGNPVVAHGDLSTKNVLWSLQGGPAVYLIDCDSSRVLSLDGELVGGVRRPYVATPNWEDPASSGGGEPGVASDRYSLALIFLRVVGAAHYPIQARQKQGEKLAIDVEIPPWGRRAQRLSRDSPVWDLCSRGLGIKDVAERPSAGEWREVLEVTLREQSARHLVEAVQAAQGEPQLALPPLPDDVDEDPPEREVTVRGRPAEIRPERWQAGVRPALPASWQAPVAAGTPGPWRQLAPGAPLVTAGPAGAGVRAQTRRQLAVAIGAWWLLHRRAALALRSPGRRGQGVRRLALCVVTDFATACVGLFLVAMIVSPFLGI